MRFTLIGLFILSAVASADEVTIQPGLAKGKDAFCWEQQPDSNFGVSYLLKVYSSDSPLQGFASFIEFIDLSYYRGQYANSATLYLYTQAVLGTGGEVEFGAADAFWDDDLITWNSMPDIDPHTLDSAPYPTAVGEWWEADVTDIVRGWLGDTLANHGFKLYDDGTGAVGATFYASEYMVDETLRPKLVIELSDPAVEETSFGCIKAQYR
jgi:hypothetical protein